MVNFSRENFGQLIISHFMAFKSHGNVMQSLAAQRKWQTASKQVEISVIYNNIGNFKCCVYVHAHMHGYMCVCVYVAVCLVSVYLEQTIPQSHNRMMKSSLPLFSCK